VRDDGKKEEDIMRRVLVNHHFFYILSFIMLLAGVMSWSTLAYADTSPRVTAIGLSGAVAALDSTVGSGNTVYVVGEFSSPVPDTLASGVYYNSTTGLDKIKLAYYSASPPTSGSLINYVNLTVTNLLVSNDDSTFSFRFTVPSLPGNCQSIQVRFGLYSEDVGAFGDQRTSYLAISPYTPCNDPVDANHAEYLVYVADTETLAPSLTVPASGARDNQNFNISFTLPEAASSGTVQLIFLETGGANAPYQDTDTLTLTSSYEISGTHSFVITGQNLDSLSSIVVSESGNIEALVDSSLYTVAIQYQDAAGNPVASSQRTNILYDNVTYPPTFATPAAGGYSVDDTVAVNYTLPEAANYVKLIFTWTGGTPDYASPHTLTLYAGGKPQGNHQFNLIGNNIGTNSSYVAANPYGAVDSLIQQTIYRVTLEYKDQMQNDAEQVIHNAWTYYEDTVTQTPTLDDPASGDRDNSTFAVSFTLPETAYPGSVKLRFTRTSGTADPATYHEMTLSSTASDGLSLVGTNLAGTAKVTAVTGGGNPTQNNVFVDGTVYSVIVKYRDASNNPEASSVTATGVIYDNSTSAPTLDLPTVNSASGTPIAVQYDQPEAATISTLKLTFTRTGGSVDNGAPHILTLSSLVSGQNKTLSVLATNLSGTSGVSSVQGGNLLISGSIYTVRIEYQDDLGNAAAYAENSGFTYTSGIIVYAMGDDINEGAGFIQGSINNPIFQLRLNTNSSSAAFTSVTFATSGTAETSDIQTNGCKLWRSADATFSANDTLIVTIQNFIIGNMTFSGFSRSINTSYSYFFFTIDVSSTAEGTDNVLATIQSQSDINVGSNTVSGSFPMGGLTGHPLPVELVSFDATPGFGKVTLAWVTASETNNEGFNVYRSTARDGGYTEIASYQSDPTLRGQITSPTTTHYTYQDVVPFVNGVTYYYKLETVDINNFAEFYEGIASAAPFEPIRDYRLDQNYPNPFNPVTTIPYHLPVTSKVTIKIYDILGREVTALMKDVVQPTGHYTARWDGTSHGIPVASGTYFYRIEANRFSEVRRMVLLR
jgi:hypothetical protein